MATETEAPSSPSLGMRGRSPSSIMSKEEEEEMENMVRLRRGERSSAFYGGIPPMTLAEQTAAHPRSSGLSAPGLVIKNPEGRVSSHSERLRVGYADTVGKRPTMEDEITVVGQLRGRPDEDYVAIFDGHGGNAASVFASKHLHSYLVEKLNTLSDPAEALKAAFVALNERMKEEQILGGTTALVFLLVKNTVYIANAGDSRAVLCRNNTAVRVSNDHKPELPEEEERIVKAGGSVTRITNKQGKVIGRVNGMLAVSRALGDFLLQPYVTPEPDVQQFQLTDHTEQIVLACDGIWDVVSDQEAADVIVNAYKTTDAAEESAVELREIALNRQSTDNISVIVISLPPADPSLDVPTTSPSTYVKRVMVSAAVVLVCSLLAFSFSRGSSHLFSALTQDGGAHNHTP